jgi:hypothetical protein
MAERPSMNVSWNTMSTATKILLVGGLLFFIDLFLTWYTCSLGPVSGGCASGWHGILGVLVGLLVILILVMEAITLFNVSVTMGTPQMRNQVEGGAAILLFVLAVLHFLLKPSGGGIIHVGWGYGAFIGLILAIAIGYGGWMRWQEGSVTTPPPAPGGGFAA